MFMKEISSDGNVNTADGKALMLTRWVTVLTSCSDLSLPSRCNLLERRTS